MGTIQAMYKYDESKLTFTGALGANPAIELRGNTPINLAIAPTGGNAKVQYTLSPKADVLADTAVWTDWTAGDKATYTEELLNKPYRFLRVYNTTATSTILYICR